MEINLNEILLVVSFLLILILFFLFLKSRESAIESEREYESLKEDYGDLKIDYAVLHSKSISNEKNAKERLETLQIAKEELSLEFKLLANKIFEDKSRQFSHTHKEQFELLLKPFREQITNFSSQSREQFNIESKDRHILKDELVRLKDMNKQLSEDATNLANALKGENKTQGNWGEIILERILEESGLRKGIEYETQATLKSQDNALYRPDVIIHMPDKRDIVIDSKVSLVAYEKFMNEEDLELKRRALKEHLASISNHIKELSAKEYEKLEGINSLDYVLLFMPIEGAFLIALSEDGEFFKKAYDKNILVVSPSTLLVTLRTIEHIWRTQRQQDNAKKIADEAEAMYDKLVGFVDDMNIVGAHIQKTELAFESAMKKLSSGRGNLIKRAENMKTLGLKPKKNLAIKSEQNSET